MKKNTLPLLWVIVGTVLAGLGSLLAVSSLHLEPDARLAGLLLAAMLGLCSGIIVIGALIILGAARPRYLEFFLSDGDIFKLVGYHEGENYECGDEKFRRFHLLIELKPGTCKYIIWNTNCDAVDGKEIVLGYYYRYLLGKFERLPISKQGKVVNLDE